MADVPSPTGHAFLTALFRQDRVEPLNFTALYGDRPGDGSITEAVRFAAGCVGSGFWAQLEDAWTAVDLTRMAPATMLSLLTGTYSSEAQAALPGCIAYKARCADEMRRRGLADKVSLFTR